MKIAILTLPIHSNFGYIMQLYALQTVLCKLGYEAETIQLNDEPRTFWEKVKYFILSFIVKYLLGHHATPFRKWPDKSEMEAIDANTWDFLNKHCKLTVYISSVKKLSELNDKYDVFIVGSDQVWRRRFSIDIPSFFFSFLKDDKKRIAYAASFGISYNDYNPVLTSRCKSLLSKFHSVGVRELDAVDICKKEFEVEATHVLDPTLLLPKGEYEKLIESDKVQGVPLRSYLLLYILDLTPEKKSVAEKIAKEQGLEIYSIKPSDFGKVGSKHIKNCIYPHISTWLYAFIHASYIITDSFHGTVFSIIFEKQFLVFDNTYRGQGRVSSLLIITNLQERLYSSDFKEKKIYYDKVAIRISEEQKKSLRFIVNSIKNK